MRRFSTGITSVFGVAGLLLCIWIFPGVVAGQDYESLEEQPAVRHRVLYRSTRLELTPSIATTLNEPYINDRMVNLNLVYHLTDSLNLGLFGGYSVLQSKTDLPGRLVRILRENDSNRLNRLGYSYTQWLAGFELGYVPVFGKFSLFQSETVHYDIHLLGGFSFVKRAADKAVASGPQLDPVLSGTEPSPTVGVGSRLYLSDGFALNLQFRDYIYPETPLSAGSGETKLSQNYMLTLGISMFLPGDAPISR